MRIEYGECSFLDGSRGDNVAIWWGECGSSDGGVVG